jgi:hypothetical protein
MKDSEHKAWILNEKKFFSMTAATPNKARRNNHLLLRGGCRGKCDIPAV